MANVYYYNIIFPDFFVDNEFIMYCKPNTFYALQYIHCTIFYPIDAHVGIRNFFDRIWWSRCYPPFAPV
jgi:hypothetical protein